MDNKCYKLTCSGCEHAEYKDVYLECNLGLLPASITDRINESYSLVEVLQRALRLSLKDSYRETRCPPERKCNNCKDKDNNCTDCWESYYINSALKEIKDNGRKN